jgi:hypothetical protein
VREPSSSLTCCPSLSGSWARSTRETLYIRHSVARWTGQAGDPAKARDQYRKLLSVRARILGPTHPDTKVAQNNLRYWTEKADSEAN